MTEPETNSETLPAGGEIPAGAVEDTKEPFDEARAMDTIRKLRENEKAAKKVQAELDRYKAEEEKRKQAEMSETERLQAELAKAQAELKRSQLDGLKRQTASKAGLPDAFADRLQGETPEELEADAQAILSALTKQKAAPNAGTTNPGVNGRAEETWAQKKARLEGEPGNIWHGGGINWGANDTQ